MKTVTQSRKHGRSIVLGKEMFSGYTSTSPERVSVREEGEGHINSSDLSFFQVCKRRGNSGLLGKTECPQWCRDLEGMTFLILSSSVFPLFFSPPPPPPLLLLMCVRGTVGEGGRAFLPTKLLMFRYHSFLMNKYNFSKFFKFLQSTSGL